MSQHIDPEVKQSFIVDNLTTNDSGKALSAAQGKVLNEKLVYNVLNPDVLQVSSYSDFQTVVASTISAMANHEIRSIVVQKMGSADNVFKGSTWFGHIAKLSNAYVTILLTTYNGDILRLWTNNGTWNYSNVIDSLNGKITEMQTLQQDTYNSGSAMCYKVGRVCFITCIAGTWYNTGAGTAIKLSDKTGWVLPEGFRPKLNCEIKEALNGKRITIMTTGEVTCPETLSGVNLRFSGCFING